MIFGDIMLNYMILFEVMNLSFYELLNYLIYFSYFRLNHMKFAVFVGKQLSKIQQFHVFNLILIRVGL